jgi:oligopeptide/dipeptide ABC transporter ATP-binding protein
LLDVRQLSVRVSTARGRLRLIDRVDLAIRPGERVALVGESGSGKSVFARSLLRLDRDTTLDGSVLLEGEDLLTATERRMRELRGARIGIVFQDPLSSLDPMMRVGDQVAEGLRIRGVSKREARARALDALDRLGVPNVRQRLDAYPHEFSGGMRQRVCLAAAMALEPALLIADEPTTALDVRVQEQVLAAIDELAGRSGVAVLLITHDLGIVAGFADRVVVMYAGRKIEEAETAKIYPSPQHPYTAGLLRSVPRIDHDPSQLLRPIPGAPASPADRVGGCPFHPRCDYVADRCAAETPVLRLLTAGQRSVACHHPLPAGDASPSAHPGERPAPTEGSAR